MIRGNTIFFRSRLFLLIAGFLFFFQGVGLSDEFRINIESILTVQNLEKLEKGEVVLVSQSYKDNTGKLRAKGAAAVLIDRPADQVWTVLTDFSNYPKFMPRLISAKSYRNDGNTIGVEFMLKVVFKKVTYNILHQVDREKNQLTLSLDHSRKNDIAETAGIWLIRPRGDRKTLLAHSVTLDSGLSVPKAIEDYLTKKDLPNVVTAVKKRVESNGAYTK